jgi:hypothetical protein
MITTPKIFLSRLNRLFTTTVIILLLAGCAGENATLPIEENNTIGPGGGSVADGGGASITIPSGALDKEHEIKVSTYAKSDECPNPTGSVPHFIGGAKFEPSGLEFNVPVTVTIPSNQNLTPGSQFPLFLWNESRSGWEQTEFIATVSADGNSFSAEITHFSVFGGFGGMSGDGIFGEIDGPLCSGGDVATVLMGFITSFLRDIANVGDKGIYDGQCKSVTGIDFDLKIEIEGNLLKDFVRLGEPSAEGVLFVYTADCGDGSSSGGMIDATIAVYYDCSAPELSVSADPSTIEPGESSTAMAILTCGGKAYTGQLIQFECFGDGDITENDAVTNPAGQAQTMYNAPEQNCQATVAAYYDACAGQESAQTVQENAVITVGGSWSGTLTVTFNHPIGNPPLINFADVLTINFTFDISENSIAGAGTGSHNVDITPGGDCTLTSLSAPSFDFVVLGSAREQELEFTILPAGLMPLMFVLTCFQDDPVDIPYPPYGALEGSIITENIKITLPRANNATDSGSGSESWGEDLPMYYSYTATVQQRTP